MDTGYLARRPKIRLLYENTDISKEIAEDLVSFSWADKSAKEADDLQVTLHNLHGLWLGSWMPAKGAKLTASLTVRNWERKGDNRTLPCGTFEIDEINSSGPPSQVTIKAVSTPVKTKIRGTAKTRAWEAVRLSGIAGDFAREAGLSLVFELKDDPEYDRRCQMEETDLAFLQGLCADCGASLKVAHDRLIIFDEQEYEGRASVLTVTPKDFITWDIKSKITGVHKACKVSYHDPEQNEDIEFLYDPGLKTHEDDENAHILQINQRCKSLKEAERLAKKALRDGNKYEMSGSFSKMGDLRIVAGVCIDLKGLGRLDDKYIVDSATHVIGNGYVTTAEIRRVLGTKKGSEIGFQNFDAYGKDYGDIKY